MIDGASELKCSPMRGGKSAPPSSAAIGVIDARPIAATASPTCAELEGRLGPISLVLQPEFVMFGVAA
jgi:hypothetical protein